MATKAITLEIDAYEKLRAAKREPRESFSQVVRRARFEGEPTTSRRLLEDLRALAKDHPKVLRSNEALSVATRNPRHFERIVGLRFRKY